MENSTRPGCIVFLLKLRRAPLTFISREEASGQTVRRLSDIDLPKCCKLSFTGTSLCNPLGLNASLVILSRSVFTIGSNNRSLLEYMVHTSLTCTGINEKRTSRVGIHDALYLTTPSTMSISKSFVLALLNRIDPLCSEKVSSLSFCDILIACWRIVGLCASNIRAEVRLITARTQPKAITISSFRGRMNH